MRPPAPIRLLVWGEAASFTRDDTPAERDTYPMLTVPAAEAILAGIFWRPFFTYEVSAISVLSEVNIYTVRGNELRDHPLRGSTDALKNRTQRIRRLIHQPAYLIEAAVVLCPEVPATEGYGKALGMFTRRAEAGQCYERPYFGMREYPAHFRLLEPGEGPRPWDRDGELGPLPLIRRDVADPQGPLMLTRHHHDAESDRWVRQRYRGRRVTEYMDGAVFGGVLTVPRYRSGT